MSPDLLPPILFLHLLAVFAFLAGLGYEAFVVLAGVPTSDSTLLRKAMALQQYMMVPVFVIGGMLIGFLKHGEASGFVVTIVAFLVLGALSGIAGAGYKKGKSGPGVVRNLIHRLALVAYILLGVSAKAPLVPSLMELVPFPILGEVATMLHLRFHK